MIQLSKVLMNQLAFNLCFVFAEKFDEPYICNVDLGFYGRDAPVKLIEHVTQEMAKNQPELDAILMNGDFVRHGIALPNEHSAKKEETWNLMKKIIEIGMQTVKNNAPEGIDIFPTIGNNDVVVHNQVPCSADDSKQYYKELFDIWFPEDQEPKGFRRE